MSEHVPAEVFPPGEYLKDELDARGWTQADLSEITGLNPRLISEIVTAKRRLTPETAKALGLALGTGAEYWLSHEAVYRLHQTKMPDEATEEAILRRSNLFAKAPIGEMIRRLWIEKTSDLDSLESSVLRFFKIETLDQQPEALPSAARASGDAESSARLAWQIRAQTLAQGTPAETFSQTRLKGAVEELRLLLDNAEKVRHVPRVMEKAGVRFLIVEHLRGTRVDGASFWLPRKSPVIVLTLRYDRIDYFWFTLMHEIAHIRKEDSLIDSDLVGREARVYDEQDKKEREANRFASDFLIDRTKLDGFIARKHPLYSKKSIRGFASTLNVHPGIVVGQLQFRGEIGYEHSREMLAKVRNNIVGLALTDGWGHTAPADL